MVLSANFAKLQEKHHLRSAAGSLVAPINVMVSLASGSSPEKKDTLA
jgi:hypothetical protein